MSAAFFDSTEEAFHRIAPQFWGIYCREQFGHHAELGSDFLVVIRKDESADVYLGNVPKKLEFRAKRDIGANEWLSQRDMADITAQTFIGIEIQKSDSVVYCFRHGWRFGLLFDMRMDANDELDLDEFKHRLGYANRHLIFFDDYIAYARAGDNGLIADGWFPFIQLLGGDYATLIDYYQQEDRDLLVDEFINRYAGERATAVVDGWFNDPIFDSKKQILRSGLEAFNAKTESGAILCL